MKTSLLAAVLMTLAAACAAPEASNEPTGRELDFRTGSNIPRKNKEGVNHVETISKEELERSRGSILNTPSDPVKP
jgi:hypothetical protein